MTLKDAVATLVSGGIDLPPHPQRRLSQLHRTISIRIAMSADHLTAASLADRVALLQIAHQSA